MDLTLNDGMMCLLVCRGVLQELRTCTQLASSIGQLNGCPCWAMVPGHVPHACTAGWSMRAALESVAALGLDRC